MNDKKILIYRSIANTAMTIDNIQEMLLKAKRFNAENDIRGFLVYANARFIQLIEGDNEKITQLYQKILKDVRHHDVETLLEKKTDNFIFNDWYMAFYDFTKSDHENARKRLLLESYLSQTSTSKSMDNTLQVLRSGINEILQIKNED